jgi:hypothetical protein
MMDLASALQGGGGGGPGDPGAGPGGPPPDDGGGAPPDDNAQGGEMFDNSMEALDVAEEALHAFIRMDPDDSDRAIAGRALQIVLGLKGSNQKSVASGDAKSLSRALSGSSAIGTPGG